MSKAVKKVASVGTFGVTDALDVFGDQAAAAAKKAQDQAAAEAAALQSSQTNQPTLAGDDVAAAREAERQRKLALSGQSSTILTGSSGLGANTNSGKTLLGS